MPPYTLRRQDVRNVAYGIIGTVARVIFRIKEKQDIRRSLAARNHTESGKCRNGNESDLNAYHDTSIDEHAPKCVEITITEMIIRLKIGAFRPLVP